MGIIKKVAKGVGKTVKPFVNFPKWMGLKELTSTGKSITQLGKEVLTPQTNKIQRQETFDQAINRLQLTEKDLQARQKLFLRFAFFYLFIAIMLLAYAIYLFVNIKILAGGLTILLSFLALSFAYREHFWYFQMKNRKLGYNFKEWLKGNFGGTK